MRPALAAALLAAGALAAAGCGRADHSEPVSFAEVESVIAAAGLRVCDETRTEARSPGASEEHRYDVAADCGEGGEDAVLVATAYDDQADRDGAARRFEGQAARAAQGVLWTFGPLVVRVSGQRDRDAVDSLAEVLEERGAE